MTGNLPTHPSIQLILEVTGNIWPIFPKKNSNLCFWQKNIFFYKSIFLGRHFFVFTLSTFHLIQWGSKIWPFEIRNHSKTRIFCVCFLNCLTIHKPDHLGTDLMSSVLKIGYIRFSDPHCIVLREMSCPQSWNF